jgi:hypothetical protein
MRRCVLLLHTLLAACLTAVATAGPAAAAGEPIVLSGPADGAGVTAGAPVALHARSFAGDTGLVLRISASPEPVDACGRIGADIASAAGVPLAGDLALYDFPAGRWYDRPGTWYWQVHRAEPDGSCTVTEARRITLASATAPRPDLAGLSREPIPRRIGSSNGAAYVIRTGGIPAGVSRARFLALVRSSGLRWRLHSFGTLPGRPRFGNGRSEVGFSTAQVPFEALAVTITGPTFRAGRTRSIERDLILRADLPWEPGPEHPARGEVDLQTVILHEFGHVAGNRVHTARGCSNTPMVVGLAGGEWWRSTSDFSYRACGRSAS